MLRQFFLWLDWHPLAIIYILVGIYLCVEAIQHILKRKKGGLL